jgi:hypothetical protein
MNEDYIAVVRADTHRNTCSVLGTNSEGHRNFVGVHSVPLSPAVSDTKIESQQLNI